MGGQHRPHDPQHVQARWASGDEMQGEALKVRPGVVRLERGRRRFTECQQKPLRPNARPNKTHEQLPTTPEATYPHFKTSTSQLFKNKKEIIRILETVKIKGYRFDSLGKLKFYRLQNCFTPAQNIKPIRHETLKYTLRNLKT